MSVHYYRVNDVSLKVVTKDLIITLRMMGLVPSIIAVKDEVSISEAA